MHRNRIFAALAAAGLAALAAPATAQEDQEEQLGAWCDNVGGEFTAELQISACDGLISQPGPDTNVTGAYLLRGTAYLGKGDLDLAEADYQAASAREPQNPLAYGSLADVAMARRDLPTALAHLTRAVELKPDYLYAFYWRAQINRELGDVAAAIPDISEAIRLDPKTEATSTAAMRELRGLLYRAQGNNALALADFSEMVRLVPEHFNYAMRGHVYHDVREFARAIADYDEAIRLKPDEAGYWNSRCWTRAVWGQELDRALADCTEALRLAPANAAILDSRGMVHLKRGAWAAAEADFTAALAVVPDYATAHYGRGYARLKLGRTAEGEADIARAMEIDPAIAQRYRGDGIAR